MDQELLQRYLSRAASARYLTISERKLDALVASHQIPAIRIGRRVLFDLVDLDAFASMAKESAGAM